MDTIGHTEKISGQTFTDILNLCYDLDLERSNSMFPQNTLAYDAVLQNQVWLQTDQFFRRYSENSHPGHSAKSAGGRLHLNMHTPLTQ